MRVNGVLLAIILFATTGVGAHDQTSAIRQGRCSRNHPAAQRLGREVQSPVVLRRVEAAPRRLEAVGFKCGDFLPVLEAVIGKDGRVICVSLIPPPDKQISRQVAGAFEETIAQWTFRPATRSGQPVEAIMYFVINMRCA